MVRVEGGRGGWEEEGRRDDGEGGKRKGRVGGGRGGWEEGGGRGVKGGGKSGEDGRREGKGE